MCPCAFHLHDSPVSQALFVTKDTSLQNDWKSSISTFLSALTERDLKFKAT